ncbi:SbtR family transcriptional regulator [[Mycobacterium] appelbergii]|uniref:SbtR family transcriptional regulator n=1 Tax=[Mycobacterium] appelbergii TaxID=2939269 RepID=UPI0039778E28
MLAVIDEGLIELHRLGTALLDTSNPLDALREWLEAYIAQAGMFDGLAKTLAATPTDSSEACRLSRDAGAALVSRAAEQGAIRPGVDIVDVLDLAAAITWIGEQPERSEAQRDRLLQIVLDGIRTP